MHIETEADRFLKKEQSAQSTSDTSLLLVGAGGSLTWVSDETRERDNFRKVRANIGFVAPDSLIVPRDMREWLAHREAVLRDDIRNLRRLIEAKKNQKSSSCTVRIQAALAGIRFGDFRSTVLARETIWRPDEIDSPSRPQAPWPDSSERKHEGYQRVRSGYCRFPPLPRVPGNATVNWKQRSPITPYEFDQVGRPVAIQEANKEDNQAMEWAIDKSLLRELEE